MTEFTELNFSKDVADMDEEEAKKTLSEFMEAHRKNQEAYDDVHSEMDELETQYQEQIDEYEEKFAEFTREKAEEAAEYVKMPADLLAERFDYSELVTIIEDGEEADFSEEDENEDEDEPKLTTFSEKPEKGRAESKEPGAQYRETAKEKLEQHW